MVDFSLKQRIQEDMNAARRARDQERLGVVSMILAAIKQVEVDERIELDDARIVQILNKMLKQRRDSIVQFIKGNRHDLAEKERLEELAIAAYLPKSLTEEEIDHLVSKVIKQTQATSIRDMGKVMAELKRQCQGSADMVAVSAKVKDRLPSS